MGFFRRGHIEKRKVGLHQLIWGLCFIYFSHMGSFLLLLMVFLHITCMLHTHTHINIYIYILHFSFVKWVSVFSCNTRPFGGFMSQFWVLGLWHWWVLPRSYWFKKYFNLLHYSYFFAGSISCLLWVMHFPCSRIFFLLLLWVFLLLWFHFWLFSLLISGCGF